MSRVRAERSQCAIAAVPQPLLGRLAALFAPATFYSVDSKMGYCGMRPPPPPPRTKMHIASARPEKKKVPRSTYQACSAPCL